MYKKYLLHINLLLAIGLFTFGLAFSQQEGSSKFTLHYVPSMTMGDAKDFADEFSFRGFGLSYEYFVKDNLSVGISSGLSTYYDPSDGLVSETIEMDNNTITLSAKEFNYINSIPILLTSSYYYGEAGKIKPYVSIGIGGYNVLKWKELGLYRFEDNKFLFGIAPAVGVSIPIAYSSSLDLGVRYNQAFGSESFSSLDFRLGFSWFY
ncbi:OmpW family outer membrane protein [Echinicola shivajiensis]|uniref:OmpW family outer membrane protein n=1 Tax=Echinicola shivajiensis TaxID=1035916 RepID=UPI001BFC955D|nr:OmpW family outer membrane protein [Echinicola shivajiensis]